eukprot:TRINITY_DN43243_c0_g1_i1.p1 TRINITY_DN43243_c0_g1~~TRINITY_DN43243_c0_g1_i1.p1  ORF type:complete len:293 (-),score=37.66 TRINITY_DN43243_c0_g1_i1:290-1168(-)
MGHLQTLRGEAVTAVAFAVFWGVFIEVVRHPMARSVRSAAWWPRALPNQVNFMVNFGFSKAAVTEDVALYGFIWVVTMCITHVVSASLMVPVIVVGWEGAGDLGQQLFLLGTLSEVGFDIYDWIKGFLLTFFRQSVPFLGPQNPVKAFIVLCMFHHTTVLSIVIPMNLKYPSLAAYHWIGFSLLGSAGVCYLAGQYKFTLDAGSQEGLAIAKKIMVTQFVMNWVTRVFVWFPAVYSSMRLFHEVGDQAYLVVSIFAALGMSTYNVILAVDATLALIKWLPRKAVEVEERKKN